MKKIISLISFLIVVLISTIAFSNPLSGTYTIGGIVPDYATFNAAVTDLVTNGVSGAVTFNVRTGIYNEQIAIGTVTGASSANTIKFTSETGITSNVTLTYSASSAGTNFLIKLTNSSYLTFDHLTFTSTGANYSTVFFIENSSLHYTITNCVLNAPVTTATTTDQSIIVNSSSNPALLNCSNGVINYNTFNNGSYGMYFLGNCSMADCYIFYTDIMHNSFLNQYAYGIYQFRALFSMIKFNTITTNVTNSGYYGMYFNIFFEDSVTGNNIYHCPGNGIWHDNGDPRIFNNFIQIEGTGVNYGLTFTNMNEEGTTTLLGANTVLVLNTNPNSAAFYIPPGYNQPLNFVIDNIFVNRGGGYAVNIVETGEVTYPNGWGIQTLYDYNDYYTTGPYLGKWAGIDCATLADWQSTISGCGCGGDANSLNINPSFVSNTDLRLTVDNLGYAIYSTMVPYDIDQEDRNNAGPDMGADEFGGSVFVCDIEAGMIMAASDTICNNTTVDLSLMGNSTGAAIQWQSGTTLGVYTPIAGANSSSYTTIPLSQTTYFYAVVDSALCGDTTLAYEIVVHTPEAGTVTATLDTVCKNGTTDLIVSGYSTGGTIHWESGTTIGNYSPLSGATSFSYTTAPLGQTTYFIAIVNLGMCADTTLAKEIVVLTPNAGSVTATLDTVCKDESTDLIVSGYSSGGTIQWESGTTLGNYSLIAGATSPTYTTLPLGQTTYFVAIVNLGVCADTTIAHEIFVPIPPVAAFTNTVTGYNVTFNSSSIGADTYQWSFGDDSTSTQQNPNHSYTTFGTFHVCLTVSLGICSDSVCHDVVIEDTSSGNSITNIEALNWKIHPNPVADYFFIEGSISKASSIELYNVLGRRLLKLNNETVSGNEIKLDVSELPDGIYFLKIKTSNADYMHSVIKQ